MQRAFWIQYTSLKVIMDKSFFFFILCLTTQIFPVWCVQCEDEHCPLQPVGSSSGCSWHWAQLAFSLHNNPPEHLNMALSVPPSVSSSLTHPHFSVMHLNVSVLSCNLGTRISAADLSSEKQQVFFFCLKRERLLLKSQSWDLSKDKTERRENETL